MSDELLLTIDVDDRGADVVAKVTGELDFGTTPELLEVVEPLAASGRSLVLDLVDLTFCDSSALSALVRLHKTAAAAGGALSLARLRPQVEAAITVTMLHRLLEIHAEVPSVHGGSGRS
ncbi:anti-sigma-factor antagonist [Kribbella flavida DSM 17836]|uniref:Anti-sigma factor antagonist n=1 Tax=Kribbella flavida (strain DSM 17836 / JCM 10339 / NBRC 14399) TaxID=479435 RepID=D2PM26_KRIFD|nr:STAS domain-containing protein [Kribbella flavida]ADB34394.1 anti-sigma-factor antagonist [Kribbella flavida DSM 17836]